MNRVKLFHCESVSKLESNINDFFAVMEEKWASFELIDIKYNCFTLDEMFTDKHTAMIIYKY